MLAINVERDISSIPALLVFPQYQYFLTISISSPKYSMFVDEDESSKGERGRSRESRQGSEIITVGEGGSQVF